MGTEMDQLVSGFIPLLTSYGARLIGVCIILWVSFRIAHWAQARVTGGLRVGRLDETLALFFGNLARWVIIIGALLACLSVFGIETTSFAAIIGAASLAVGLAFQGTLSNFAAGVMLLVFRPFRVGDFVKVAGETGTVIELSLFTTALDTLEGNRIIIPNSAVTTAIIRNYTHTDYRRVDINLGVTYKADIDTVRRVLDEAMTRVPGRAPEKGHQVFLVGFGASAVDWQLRVWCRNDAYWDVYEAIIREAKKALEDAGILIPFQQLDIHLQTRSDLGFRLGTEMLGVSIPPRGAVGTAEAAPVIDAASAVKGRETV